MSGRSSVLQILPVELRKQLDQQFIDNKYKSLTELSKWLEQQGYPISRTVLGRYKKGLDCQMAALEAATEQTRVMTEEAAGDEGQMTEVLARLVQRRLFSVLVEFAKPLKTPDLARIAKTISDLGRASISHQRWTLEVAKRLEQQQGAAAAEVASLERQGGLTRESAEAMRNLLLGIDPLAAERPEPS